MTDSPATVLVVDDSPLVLEIVRDALEARGYRVETTDNPLDCERLFAEVEPDVLVVDIEMPVLDGLAEKTLLCEGPTTQPLDEDALLSMHCNKPTPSLPCSRKCTFA